jgi:hypothetical protein
MNAWPYVIAAYAVTLGAMALIALASWQAMRRAEKERK